MKNEEGENLVILAAQTIGRAAILVRGRKSFSSFFILPSSFSFRPAL
jgi:hypothetical protein